MADITQADPRLTEGAQRTRSQVADVDRSLYDFVKSEEGYERFSDGLFRRRG